MCEHELATSGYQSHHYLLMETETASDMVGFMFQTDISDGLRRFYQF